MMKWLTHDWRENWTELNWTLDDREAESDAENSMRMKSDLHPDTDVS